MMVKLWKLILIGTGVLVVIITWLDKLFLVGQ